MFNMYDTSDICTVVVITSEGWVCCKLQGDAHVMRWHTELEQRVEYDGR